MTTPTLIKENSELIRALEPEKQSIPYIKNNWDRYLNNTPPYQTVIQKHTSSITRGEIFAYKKSISTQNQDEIESLFIMTMLFGFGKTNYGPYRTNNMLSDRGFHSLIMKTYADIQSNDIENAYKNFQLDSCGSAFFTKIFYFFGQGISHKNSPLILDSVVAKNLEEKCKCDISKYASVQRHSRNTKSKNYNPILAGRIQAVSSYYDGYKNYIDDMHAWASDINVKADQIELFLFNQ
jgi:hypothetical protein